MTGSSRSPLSPGPRTRSASSRARGPGRDPGHSAGRTTDIPTGLALALWLLAAGLAAFTILRAISPDDEGLMLQAGARIADGQWPYRDFWSNYPPGEAVLLAALDKLFGVSMLSWRMVWVAVCATTSLLGFRLVHRETGSLRLALLAWLGIAGAMAWPSTPEPDPTAFMLALAALWLAPRRALPAGAVAGLTVFFRLEIGGAAVLGVLVMVAPGERLRALAAAVAVAAVSLGPFVVAAPGAIVHDTIGFFAIQAEQRLPLPIVDHGSLKPEKLLEFYYPLLLLIGAGIVAVVLVAQRRSAGRLAVALLPLGIVGVAYLLGRTDEFHLLPLSAVLAMLLACAASSARSIPALRIVLAAGVAVIALAGIDRRAGQALHPPPGVAMPGPAGDGVQTSPADARSLRALIATVHRLTGPGQPIFVADPRFDEVRAGDPLLYLTLDRPNPTRYDVMQPGLVTTASVQRQIIASLRRSHPRVVIRWLNPTADSPQPGAAGRSSGVHLLDRFIAAHYRDDVTYGYYRVLVAR